jgi:excisionase family DNA binding protein
MPGEDILTLSEAASLLRVEEDALAELASRGAVPAQKIGEDWRFLKGVLLQWLHYGPHFQELLRVTPHFWPQEPLLIDRLVYLLEQRLLGRMEAVQRPPNKPGSKQAVRRHVGVFKSDDREEVLAGLSALREAADEGFVSKCRKSLGT